MNGPFDPEYTLGGGQPLGYADLAQQYNRAIVHRSWAKVAIEIRDSSVSGPTGAATSIVAGIHKTAYNADTSMGAFNTIEELMERCNQRTQNERFIWRRINRVVSGYNANVARGGRQAPLKLSFSALPVGVDPLVPYGRLSTEVGGDPYGLTFDTGSTPTNPNYFSIFAFSQFADGGTVTPRALPYTYFDINIWYDIEFFSPVLQVQ